MENKNENEMGLKISMKFDEEIEKIYIYYYNNNYYVKINNNFIRFKTRKVIFSYIYNLVEEFIEENLYDKVFDIKFRYKHLNLSTGLYDFQYEVGEYLDGIEMTEKFYKRLTYKINEYLDYLEDTSFDEDFNKDIIRNTKNNITNKFPIELVNEILKHN